MDGALKRHPVTSAFERTEAADMSSGRRCRIAIVEDEPRCQEMFREYLELYGRNNGIDKEAYKWEPRKDFTPGQMKTGKDMSG